MIDILREPDIYRIEYESDDGAGAALRFEKKEGLSVYLSSPSSPVKFVCLRWRGKTEGECKILGDGWERLYGNAEWRGIVPERKMPWYFFVSSGNTVQGCGVKVLPNAMCHWQFDRGGVTLVLDVRSASKGVRLGSRELFVCEVVSAVYEGLSPFAAAKRFCALMSPSPLLPSEPVYGSNNWYYAYGNSSHEDIMKDSEFVSMLTPGIANRPYMVIDDGWSPNMTCGPWDRGNERFPDMPRLVREMKDVGVKPGIWIRALYDDSPFIKDGHTLAGHDKTLDPTDPAVLAHIAEDVARIRDWGVMLLKHDYSAVDVAGRWGAGNSLFLTDDRRFMNDSITSAEAVKTLYRTIYEAAGDMIVLGCNCVNHLCVGSVHLNRIGDDTSGEYWDRTRKMGVNCLAFRLCQDEHFFKVDADCVGLTAAVPWEYNRQWLELLSKSGTPLFVSAKIDDCNEEIKQALREAFALAAVQKTGCEPLDWMNNTCPAVWRFGEETRTFSWDEELGVGI